MSARGSRYDVSNQRFIPALHRKVPVKPVSRAPMPQKSIVVVYMPTPIGSIPHLVDPSNQISFLHSVSIEIGSSRQQSHHQIGGLHHVSAIVQSVERNGLSGIAIDKMRVNAMIGVGFG